MRKSGFKRLLFKKKYGIIGIVLKNAIFRHALSKNGEADKEKRKNNTKRRYKL